MAKTYSRSEITPDLLNLNLQYFFGKPARDYKRAMDEIILENSVGFERWIHIMDHWNKFLANPPVVDSKLRTIAEKLSSTATADNMETILDIFDDLSGFMVETFGEFAKEETIHKVVDEAFELNRAIYDTTAEEERKVELKRLAEEREAEEKAEIDALIKQTTEQVVLGDLQAQIVDLRLLLEKITIQKDADEDAPKVMLDELMDVVEAKARIDEARENANKIADLMENEIKQQREAEELARHEELIKRLDEKEEFDAAWNRYFNKYTKDGDKPTVALFEKFLIDVKGITPQQLVKMEVSAAMFENGIANFIDFDQELQRVKKTSRF